MKIKKLLLVLIFSISFCYFSITKATTVFSQEQNFYYTSNVSHLFTHCLIAYPEIAFSENNYMSKHYSRDCITANEFIKILEELYKNDYILVNLSECFEVKNNVAEKRKIKVPVGKKPLVLSFDDVNYDSSKKGKGMVDKIIIDKNGNLATSTFFADKTDIRYDNEFVCILENFIKINPNFSLNNAKGTLNLTGYDGILGYRTSHNNTTNLQSEIDSAKKVAKKLKENGWEFASHSYGHYHMQKISDSKFEQELMLWKQEVEPIIGKTQVYVYPYGEWEVFNKDGTLSNKHKLLNKYGFNLFCGVGMKTFYSYLPNANHKVLFMDRKCIDGYTLTSNRKELFDFFNPQVVIDASRR